MKDKNSGVRLRTVRLLLYILAAATLAFIWGNSADSRAVSDAKSDYVGSIVTPLLELFVGKGNVTARLVRKLAHFCEFGALGCELGGLHRASAHRSAALAGSCLFVGLLSAVIDETIQMFSGRYSAVTDVLLDFSGVCTGMAGIAVLCALVGVCAKHSESG